MEPSRGSALKRPYTLLVSKGVRKAVRKTKVKSSNSHMRTIIVWNGVITDGGGSSQKL